MSIVNDLNRLERAGSDCSRVTQKLREAAEEVACRIEKQIDQAELVGKKLPRGYRVYRQKSNVGSCLFLSKETGGIDEWGTPESFTVDGCGGYLHGDFNSECAEKPTSAEIAIFAKDIATGLLGEIAEFIESRTTGAEQSIVELESAIA